MHGACAIPPQEICQDMKVSAFHPHMYTDL